jgi:hypothetical protein
VRAATITDERTRAAGWLRDALDRETSTVYTLTTYGRGETDYVRLFTARLGDFGPELVDLTYHVAKAAGRRVTREGIAYGGGNFSKGLEGADDCWRAAFGEPVPQSRGWTRAPGWAEL